MPGLKIFEALDQMPEMVDPQTGLVQPKQKELSVSEKQNFSNENIEHIKYDKGLFFDEAKNLQEKDIALGSDPVAVNELLAEKQSSLGATVNALTKFVGKTAITVGDTIGGLAYIPSAIINGDLSKMYDNDFHRWMDKQSKNLDSALPIYATQAQEKEGFFSKLNNAQFWGDGVLGGMSFSVGAVLSEMALSALTASTFGTGGAVQIAETASLMSRAKKIFSLFGREASQAELKALGKSVAKSVGVGAGYEAGVEARNFLDTARENYAEQFRQQYGVEPNEQQLANADGEIKKTANLLFGSNMALLSVDNFIQFKNIFGKGLSTDLKLFGKGAVDTKAKDLAKDYALRGTLNAAIDNTSKLRKALYTIPKVLKNPLTEMNEEALQGQFQAIGQDYIKKKFDATSYNDSFNLIESFNKNFKDSYASEDAGIGFIIGAMGIPGMGLATGKTKNVKGFGNKVIASFEGGVFEAFEEQNAEKNAIKTAINQASKVNIDNVQNQIQNNSAILTSNKLRDEALENGDFFNAKNHESDALFSFVKSRDNVGLLNESKEQYSAMIKEMDNATFAKEFGYDKLDANERALTDSELSERKTKVIEQFNKRVDNFQETKDLASKVAPVRDFNDKDARLFNEAIHHLMYTTNDLDSREDNLVDLINNKLSKSKNDSVNNDRLKELMSFHNTWFNLTEGKLSKELEEYNENLNILKEESLIDIPTEDDLNSKKSKAEAKIKQLKDVIETKLNEINTSKNKLSNLGFKIDNNFENVDNFVEAIEEFKTLQKNIENHLSENIFDKDTIEESLIDLAKIQNKRHELIGTYNVLNTKNGKTKFNEEAKKNERQFKIEYLKLQASTFLHNQGLEMDIDTVKEIETNVDLQINEDDNPEVKAQKEYLTKLNSLIESETDIEILNTQIAHLKQYKENIDDSLKPYVNTLIVKANEKIKQLKASQIITDGEISKDKSKAIFSDINELIRLMNKDNPSQSEKLNEVISELNNSTNKDISLEEEFRKRISFTLTDLENPLPVEVTEVTQNNSKVKLVKGIRSKGQTPFQFQMKIDGVEVGGFQMPNQIYLEINGEWGQIDFSKLDNDSYLQEILKMLFPQELVSTSLDRLQLGKYLMELNKFSNKLSEIKDRKEFTFEEFDKLMKGQMGKNNFSSQLMMNITRDVNKVGDELIPIETKVEDILDDADNVITKAATKTIVVDGVNQNIILFGKSSANGKGFSKKYFVRVNNGKLERNEEGKVIWNEVDKSPEQKQIIPILENRDETINTKDSLFSLLVFNPNGYIQPLFTTNETIGKLKGIDPDESFITAFLSNKSNLSPITQIIGDNMIEFISENGNKTSSEIKSENTKILTDIFFSIKNASDTGVQIVPAVSQTGEITFRIKDKSKKETYVNTYIYFNGTDFVHINTFKKEEAQKIIDSYNKGEITLNERFEKLKPFSKIINLNEEIGKLILEGEQKQNKEGNKFYNLHSAIRGLTGNNNLNITGFYNGISLNTANQQNLENLTIKQKLNFYLYLKPDVSSVIDITSFSKNTEAKAQEAIEEQKASNILHEYREGEAAVKNEAKLEKQEEAKTVKEVITHSPDISTSNTNAVASNTSSQSFEDLDQSILQEVYSELGIPFNMLAPVLFNKNKQAIMDVYNSKITPVKTEVQDTSIEAQKADIERKNTFTREDLKTIAEKTTVFSKKGDEVLNTKKVESNLSIGDKITFFAEKERKGIWDGKAIRDEKDNPWGLIGILGSTDGWLRNDTKYDAESADLEPTKKQTPNIDKLEALNIPLKEILDSTKIINNVKAFEGKYKFIQKKYGFDLTLEEFTNAVLEIKKSELGNDGVNKLLKISDADLIEYNIAIKNLSQILPIKTIDNPNGIIEITDLIDILGNLKTKGEVAGRFISKLKTIYLATEKGKSVKGVEYHEAFHTVFRILLTDSQINKYLKSAEGLYGTPTSEQLEELRNSSSDLINLSKTELKNIWLEEKMADAFMNHKVVPQSWLARLFNKIKALLKGIFEVNQDSQLSNENTITQLFNDIYLGKYKNAKEKFPVKRDLQRDVNKLLEKSQTFRGENGGIVEKQGYFTHSISEAIINTITNETANKLKSTNTRNIHPDEIQVIIENFAETINPYSDHYQSLLDSIKDDNLRLKKEIEISDLYNNLQYQNNIELIAQEVLERLPLYNLETTSSILQEQDEEDDLQEDDVSDTGIVQKKTNEINHAWEKASKRVKQYISSISMKTDLFGIGQPFLDFIDDKNFNFALNGNYLYSNLIKILVGTPAYKHIGMLYSMSSSAPEIRAFTEHWFKDIYNELILDESINLPIINTNDFDALYKALNSVYYNTLSKSQYFTSVTSDLEKNRIYLQDVLIDNNGSTKMINANNRDVSKQVFDKWEKNWESKRVTNLTSTITNFNNIIYSDSDINILKDYLNLLQGKNIRENIYGVRKTIKNSTKESEKTLTAEEQSKAIINLFSNFKNTFNEMGIELPEQYIKFSLLDYVVSINREELLTPDQLDWYNNFSSNEINTINLDFLDHIAISFQKALTANTLTIFNDLNTSQIQQSDLGAIGQLTDIAESVAIFDPTVTPSSFNNQEGKRISDIVPPSDISRRLNIIKDKTNLNLIKSYLETGDSQDFKNKVLNNEVNNTYYFYSFFTEESQVDNFLQSLDNNPLINDPNVDLKTLFTMSYAGGVRQVEFETKDKEDSSVDLQSKSYGLFSDEDGRSYSNADDAAKILYRLSLLAQSKFNKHNIKLDGTKTKKTAYYIPSQFEGKSTVPMVQLPLQSLSNNEVINEKGRNDLFLIFKQEFDRISKTQNEIEEFFNGKKDGYNEGFHYVLQQIGIEGTNKNKTVKIFKNKNGEFFYLDIDNNNNAVTLKPEELYFNEQLEDKTYIKKQINTENLIPRGLKFFNLKNKEANVNKFAEKAIKGEELTAEEILEVKNNLSKFINFQFEALIDFLKQSDVNLINADETINVMPLGFITHDRELNVISSDNTLDRNELLNAFLNDYLMSYSINSLLYGDNATTTKDSVDWVKRAGGMIGSGSNYGSGKTNIIPIRSEVKNKIDTTDAQTFSTPFWHLMTILRSKYLDKRIIEIYQGIDSGLNTYVTSEGEIKKISKEDLDYLYDNQAQHQPNKTQGFTQTNFLKTSITAITRDTVSKLKDLSNEGKEDAIRKHKELFDFKMQLYNNAFNSAQDIRYYKHLVRQYQNLFEPIFGKEYKHNLLNVMELENSIAVYDSAWKRSKVNIHEISNGKPYLYKDENKKEVVKTISISNSSLIDQQKTDGVKAIITHATQLQRLITVEQIDETLVYFKDKEVNVKTVLDSYGKQLATRINVGFNEIKKQIIDELGKAKWDILLDSFIESTSKSSNDPQQLEFFQQGISGNPKYNLNNPAIETKFQAMFLAFISKGSLKQKVAGSKGALVSSIGHELEREIDSEGNIIKTFTTEQTKRNNDFRGANRISQRLRHDVYDKSKNEFYSEIIVTERFLRKFGFTAKQFHKGEIPQEFLYIQGVRIPTEDKHSMINAKIVDILPDSYGNAVMMPDEIIELSGADFDIDSLYIRVYQTYTNVLNRKTELYGSYLNKPSIKEAKEQAYNEYLAAMYEDKKISLTLRDLKENNQELITLNGDKLIAESSLRKAKEAPNVYTREQLIKLASSELSSIKNEIKTLELTLLEHAFNINKVVFDKDKWLSTNSKSIEDNYNAYQTSNIQNIKGLTKGETNNIILELERKLTNNTGNNKIANTPTSLDLFKNLVKSLNEEGLINKNLGYGVHDMLSKMLADKAIAAGNANIGPVALFNNLFGLLDKNKVKIKDTSSFTLLSRGRNNEILPEEQAQRVQDTIATMLAAMTDNAKEQLASQFNLTTSTLPVALTMIAVGHNFDNVMLLMKSPVVKKISELDSQFRRAVKSQEDYDTSKSKETTKEKVEAMFELTNAPEFKGELTYDVLLKSLKYWNAKPEVKISTEEREYTPENITSLKDNEVFVFGSNTEGRHGKGAALLAKNKFGAKYSQSEGIQGQSYAIITKDLKKGEKSIPLYSGVDEGKSIADGIKDFIEYANNHPETKFYVTKLGSALAGYTVEEIKDIFNAVDKLYSEEVEHLIPDNVILPREYEVRDGIISTTTIETKTTNDGKTGIKKIISGGQTGGDLGGLEGAKLLNIETGGTAPPNFISGNKSEKELLQGYGLIEGEQDSTIYTKRTMKNVDDSDGTVAILWGSSVGTGKTIGYAQTKKWQYGDNKSKNNGYKPVLVITSKNVNIAAQELKDFVLKNNIQILNIAGHREISQKGIQNFTKEVIQKAFENNDSTKPLRTKAEQLDLFNNQISNDDLHQKSILQEIINQYYFHKESSDISNHLQNLLQLIKGFRNTFAEAEKFETALNKLGYSINEDYTKFVKNKDITDKFNKEYESTKSVLGDGVDKILNDVFLKQTIHTAIDLMKISREHFISQTVIAKKTREDITTLFKDYKKDNLDFQSNLRKNYLSFLTVSAYIKSVENSDDKLPKMEEFLLTPLEDIVEDETKEYSALQNVFLELVEYNYKNGIKNDFLTFIKPHNIDYAKTQVNRNTLFGYRLNSFKADARKVKNPDNIARLISGFNELYFASNDNILEENAEIRRINTLKTKFAKDMFKFLIVKDGLMYQNTSFIKAIDPILFAGTSKVLDEVQDLFTKKHTTQKEFIDVFGKTKEELNLDFITKFALHQNNYFDLKSQKLVILLAFEKWLENNKLSKEESEEVINNNEIDVEDELIKEDNYPIFWDETNGTLVINEFARIKKGNKDPNLRRENKKFILSSNVGVFKGMPTPFKVKEEVKTYDKIGFPLAFYLTHKEKGKRTPLKLAVIQDTIKVNDTWITFQMTPEGKVTQLSNGTKDLLKDKIFYGDLQNNTIFQIINNSVKLKTFDKNKTQLVEIAKALANQFKDGYVTGTKAKYNESIIYGSGEVSSFGNSIEDQEAMSLSEEKTKNVKLNMFNRKEKPKVDETKTRQNLLDLLNEVSVITKFTMKNIEEDTLPELEKLVNNFLVKNSNYSEKEIQEKINKCK